MRVSCPIIRDLLPLYHDEVCSDDSKAMVEQHLAECGSCRAELQAMAEELSIGRRHLNLREAKPVRELSGRWRKGMLKSLLGGVLITIMVISALIFGLYLFMGLRLVPKP